MTGGIQGASMDFLELIADKSQIGAREVAVIVAHPDDETIGCGAALHRLSDVTVIVVTEGGAEADATRLGFRGRFDYAAARAAELSAALANIRCRILHLDYPDQGAAFALREISARLGELFLARSINIALTHAFEGGHPDHDAVAFCVHRAARELNISVIEMPFYSADGSGERHQEFADDGGVTVMLDAAERARKQKMIGCYVTQRAVLSGFSLDCEKFRTAPAYDFTRLPNGGNLLYERHDWKLRGEDWLALVREAAA